MITKMINMSIFHNIMKKLLIVKIVIIIVKMMIMIVKMMMIKIITYNVLFADLMELISSMKNIRLEHILFRSLNDKTV